MNEKAADILVKAALDGVKRVEGGLRRSDGSMCALGVLTNDLIERNLMKPWRPYERKSYESYDIGDWMVCPSPDELWKVLLSQEFSIDVDESHRITRQNDNEHLDFLTIARKNVVTEESHG